MCLSAHSPRFCHRHEGRAPCTWLHFHFIDSGTTRRVVRSPAERPQSLAAAVHVQLSHTKSEKYVLLLEAIERWGLLVAMVKCDLQRGFPGSWRHPITGAPHQCLLDSSDASGGCGILAQPLFMDDSTGLISGLSYVFQIPLH